MPYLSLADQIQILFDVVRHPEGRPFLLQEVSTATGMSMGTISHMRSGRILNPQLSTLRALCRFFGISLRYFETQTEDQCRALLKGEPVDLTPPLHDITYRASHLPTEAQEELVRLAQWARTAEEARRQGQEPALLPGMEPHDE